MRPRTLVLTILALLSASPVGALFPARSNGADFIAGPVAGERLNNWPSFRGNHASGIAEDQHLPDKWNGETGVNIKWKTRIPGLAHSSPIVWGNRVFVTTAVSSLGDGDFKPGLYGEGTASEDRSVHKWKLDVFVVKAAPKFELLATNPMGEPIMATPALSDSRMFIRTQHRAFAIGKVSVQARQ